MLAIVTGASSGLGRDMAKILYKKGYDLVIVARSEDKLQELKNELSNGRQIIEIVIADLSKISDCQKLYEETKKIYPNTPVDILINNAGFGLFGKFVDTDIDKELNMIDLNIKSVHVLTKLFLKDMVKENKGKIMNVASVAGFMAGPLMATYYATKNYVLRLDQALNIELKKQKSNVRIYTLCPGPVDTNFNKVANVRFSLKGASSEKVSNYAINKLLKGHPKIIKPGFGIKFVRFWAKISPDDIAANFCYKMQSKKE